MEFLKIWRIIVGRKWTLILNSLVAFAAVMIFTWLVDPTYKATAKLLVDMSGAHSSLMTALGFQDNKAISDNSEHDTDIALAKLRPLLEEVISSLDLKNRRGKAMEADKLIKWSLLNKVWPQPYIKVQQVEDADLIEIVSTSKDPEEAAKMSNKLADLYVSNTLSRIQDEYAGVRDSLRQHSKQIEEQYVKSLEVIRNFKTEKNITDLDQQAEKLVGERAQLNQVYVSMASKRVDVATNHPDYQILQKQADSLRDIIAAASRETPTLQMEASKLSLLATASADSYQKLLQYQIQLGMVQAIALSNTRLAEPAVTPTEAHFPKKVVMFVLGVILGVSWGFGLACFVEYVDNAVKSERNKAEGKQ